MNLTQPSTGISEVPTERKSLVPAWSTAAVCLALLGTLIPLLSGCTDVPAAANTQDSLAPAEPSLAENPADADLVQLVSRVLDTYTPDTDKLVNVPTLFEPMPSNPAHIARGKTLYRTLDGNPSNLNPLFGSSTYEFYMSDLLFDGLFTFDREMNWTVNDRVVESFEKTADEKLYTIRIREGLKWHDGKPYTAHDVVFSYEQIMDDRVPCPAVRSGTDQIERVWAVNDLTVKMEHKQALPTNKWNALFPVIPKHIFEADKENNPDLKSGDYNNEHNRSIVVGNGPYKFVEWRDNDKIVMERWEDFHGEKPTYEKIVFRIIPDSNNQMLAFNKGDSDEFRMSARQFATQTLEGSDFGKRGFKINKPQWQYSYIGWNADGSNPFFADKLVRRAMTHACDIERIIDQLCFNLATPCHGIFHPDNPCFPGTSLIPFDLRQAGKLLDQAGWEIDRTRQGYRYKMINGKSVKFSFKMLLPQGSATAADMAAIYQEDLLSIGVEMKTQILEWSVFQKRTREHEFEASTAAWGTGADPDTLRNIWHSESYDASGKTGRNYGKFINARVDELFDLGRGEFDAKKRIEYYREIGQIIYDEQPYTFLWNRATLWGINKEIRGVQWSPRGIFNFSPAELRWWVASEEKP